MNRMGPTGAVRTWTNSLIGRDPAAWGSRSQGVFRPGIGEWFAGAAVAPSSGGILKKSPAVEEAEYQHDEIRCALLVVVTTICANIAALVNNKTIRNRSILFTRSLIVRTKVFMEFNSGLSFILIQVQNRFSHTLIDFFDFIIVPREYTKSICS